MSRWQPDARGRLEKAALELYAERGYERTTVAEIAERAGLTERTFFRHYADKREVLFGGSADLFDVLGEAAASAPEDASPFGVVSAVLDVVADCFPEERRPHSRRRQAVIDAHPELRERELIKLARLSADLSAALRARGVAGPTAELAAETGVAVFKVAFGCWIGADEHRDMKTLMCASLVELRAVTAGGQG